MEEQILEILKYTIPGLVVFATAFFVMNKVLDNEYRKQVFEMKKGNLRTITPIRLQAYERATLFLERIDMENIVKRVNKPGIKADQLHMALMNAIRSEYEHNLSQQIYMSNDSWEAVKIAKEETLKIIHMAKAHAGNKGTALELITAIFSISEENKVSPSQKAIAILKKEIRQIF